MVMKVNLQANCWDGYRNYVVFEMGNNLPNLEIDEREARKIDKFIGYVKDHKKEIYNFMVFSLAVLTLPYTMGMSGGQNIILLLQKASFWVGMGITIWGIVEAQLDFPGWKGRIMKGVLGYIGILLVPLVFLELQSSLQVDVWQQINDKTGTPLGGQ